jgi:dTDP-4-dehydrorhamnose reductase
VTSILVFGQTGQVSTELQALAKVVTLGRAAVDLSDPTACSAAIHTHRPRVVINAAAYTAVDHAEDEETLATVINGDAPTAMAQACAALNIPLVHISTDYVFAGTGKRPWASDDKTAPQNAYGRSKLAGEQGIRATGCTHAILRTSWVFSAYGGNFVKTMLSLSLSRNELNVVDDQIGGPTPASAIAAACLSIGQQLCDDPNKTGTYHLSGAPDVSWYAFACAIVTQARRTMRVSPIATRDYPTPAARPFNSRLNCQTTQDVFGIARPDWRTSLTETTRELGISI